MAGAIYAGGIVISTMFPLVGLWEAGAAMALLAGSYTLFGGAHPQDEAAGVLNLSGGPLLLACDETPWSAGLYLDPQARGDRQLVRHGRAVP